MNCDSIDPVIRGVKAAVTASLSRSLLAVPLLLMLSGCGGEPTELREIRLWEGARGCSPCAATAIDMTAYSGTEMTLRRNSRYTLEVRLAPGHEDGSCIWNKPVFGTWFYANDPNSRFFDCAPTQRIHEWTFQTRSDAPPGSIDELDVSVHEYVEATTRLGGLTPLPDLYHRRFKVVWLD
jgi:hypothetical protein